MALDNTAKEANIQDSIKKYFVDNLYRTDGIALSFDKSIAVPKLTGQPRTVTRWVNIAIGSIDMGYLAEIVLNIYCCTIKDNEGFRLAHLRDIVIDYLSDRTQTDGMRRIPLYRSYADQEWTKIGSMVVQEIIESDRIIADDETKYKIITARLRWGCKW